MHDARRHAQDILSADRWRTRTPAAAGYPGLSLDSREIRILHIEHDSADLELCDRELKKSGLNFRRSVASTAEEVKSRLRSEAFDIILSDYRLPNWTGLDALVVVRALRVEAPVILVTGTLGEELAVECLRRGVSDYVLKHQLARLPVAIRHALEEKELRSQSTTAEQALRDSEESFRLMFAANPIPMWVFDLETLCFLEVNDAAVVHYGYSRAEFLAMRTPEIQSSVAAAPAMESFPSSRSEHAPWAGRHRLNDGSEIDVEMGSNPLVFGGRPGMLVIAQDVTERKRSLEALRESEERYRSLMQNAPFGVYQVDEAGHLIDANPALIAMLSYDSVGDLKQTHWPDVFRNPQDRLNLVQQAREGRADVEVEWRKKDGSIICVRLNSRLSREAGRCEYFETLAEDVTEKRVLAKQLLEAQKFEAIGQLAGGIAHDFNNMIGAILGWAELGRDESEAQSRLQRHFDKIRQQAQRAAALTRQLLAFARRQVLEPRDMDLNHFAAETLSLLEKVIGSNIEVRTQFAPDLASVRADPTQVEQILMNLCLNSRDAMPGGGRLAIETSNVEIGAEFCRFRPQAHPGKFVLLSVSDSGSGMDAVTLDRIFEPFFTTKETGKGTGLGLATVYGVVKQHGGFVHVESELGRGTTFRIYLPASKSALPPVVKKTLEQPVLGGSETILLAEDHEGLRDIAHETLTGLGYQVLVARDGEEALTEFRAHQGEIALAVLDVVLPKLSGPEAYLRMAIEITDLPVIFASGYSTDPALLTKIDHPAASFLHKPYTPRDLGRKVWESLQSARGRFAAKSG
jgi:two-component system, cell cycle sensor histidine kinase and response regulator CckA